MTAPAVDRPKLRLIDIRPHTHLGQPYYLLRDPLQLSEQMLLLPQVIAAVLAFVDGATTPRGIAAAFQRTHGIPIGVEMVEHLLHALDEVYLLDNARAGAAMDAARAHFRAAPSRPPTIAGQGYPDDPVALHEFLEGMLAEARRHPQRGQPAQPTPVFGLLSPHIDYPRGGSVYAQVWDRAAEAVAQADLVVMFGTDHFGSDAFTLTRQSYATPYGILPTATDIVDRLAAVIGDEAAYAGELRHRSEHSLELVAVWLHHLAGRRPVEVVPILVGGFHSYILNGHQPRQDPMMERVVAALRDASAGRRVVVVASGDLAHVGPAFGGAPLDETSRQLLHAADQELIGHMAAGDADGFFRAVHRVRDRNNVCGIAPIYLTLRLLGAVEGTPVGYAVCPADDADTSVVTVGGMVFQG